MRGKVNNMTKYELKNQLRKMTILYLEDNLERRLHFTKILKSLGAKVYIAQNSLEAMRLYEKICPDILITEIGMNGLNMLHNLRRHEHDLRIIVLTVHSKVDYLTEAVELDISRYLIQPISQEKLESALVKVVNELLVEKEKKSLYLDTDLYYEANMKSLVHDGDQISLNKKEAKLLDLFLEHSNTLLSYQEIQKHIWPNSQVSSASLRTLVKNLRKKGTSHLIQNISGSGYILQLASF
jgi:DNA-binding response OmpR family regulator